MNQGHECIVEAWHGIRTQQLDRRIAHLGLENSNI
jgi:hypothetical protein